MWNADVIGQTLYPNGYVVFFVILIPNKNFRKIIVNSSKIIPIFTLSTHDSKVVILPTNDKLR